MEIQRWTSKCLVQGILRLMYPSLIFSANATLSDFLTPFHREQR
jgi:hypothetical protein